MIEGLNMLACNFDTLFRPTFLFVFCLNGFLKLKLKLVLEKTKKKKYKLMAPNDTNVT